MKQVKRKQTFREWVDENKNALIAGGCAGVAAMVGYKIGWKSHQYAISRGIEACWNLDPTLKEHMCKVALELAANKTGMK